MSDEFRFTANLAHTKVPKRPFSVSAQIDQSGTGAFSTTVSIGTSEEDVDFSTIFPDLTTEGICVLQNLDATNYVQWGKKDGSGNMQAIGRLSARPSTSEDAFPAVFQYEPGATLRMKADTGACQVQVTIYEA